MNENLTVNMPAEETTAVAPVASATPEQTQKPEQAVSPSESAPEQATPEQATPEQVAPEQATTDQVSEALNSKGLDVASFEQEFSEKGELSTESYKKLADAGFSKDVVDRYIQANSIIMEKLVADVQAIAGGAEGYAAMGEWAKANLDAKEIEAFNKATASGDQELIRFAVSGLHARYQAAEGKAPSLVGGKAGAATSPVGQFRSMQEVVTAMSDPRYKKDPAYVRDVEERMRRSTNIF